MVNTVDIEKQVCDLMLKELPLITTLTGKKIRIDIDTVLQQHYEFDDLSDAADAYFTEFDVNIAHFDWGNYFPWKTKGFFACKEPEQDKKPLTLKIFIESAKAGRWLD